MGQYGLVIQNAVYGRLTYLNMNTSSNKRIKCDALKRAPYAQR